jgi:hypothetical protein
MPIVHSDRISGTIYVISTRAEAAQRTALDYLREKGDDETVHHYGVFEDKAAAEQELHNKFGSYDTDRDRVYAISLDIRIADEK